MEKQWTHSRLTGNLIPHKPTGFGILTLTTTTQSPAHLTTQSTTQLTTNERILNILVVALRHHEKLYF